MSFYTKTGNYIYNPEAYAKTGAPMYKKIGDCLTEQTYIYQLDLENGKKYIGKNYRY